MSLEVFWKGRDLHHPLLLATLDFDPGGDGSDELLS